MITVLGRATSVNVQFVMWAVAELGLEHERLDYGGEYGGNDTPEFLAMNPNGLVPVLRDGELALFESAAILRYLGRAYGSDTFWPRDPARLSALDQWAEWGKVTFAVGMSPLFWGLVRTPPSRRDPEAIRRAAAKIAPLARILDARIGEGPWIAGDHFTFADVAVGHYLYRYYTLPFERTATPQLDAYYARLQDRPAYREHAMVSWEGLVAKD